MMFVTMADPAIMTDLVTAFLCNPPLCLHLFIIYKNSHEVCFFAYILNYSLIYSYIYLPCFCDRLLTFFFIYLIFQQFSL